MSTLTLFALVLVAGVVSIQGSLFGPFGPLGPFGQSAAVPPTFGFPGFSQTGAFFPGFGYQPAAPVVQPSAFPGFPAGFAPVPTPFAVSRTLVPAGPAAPPAVGVFRLKPSPVVERLLLKLLPEDLQEQLNQLLVSYEEGNAACDNYNTAFSFGLYRRCVLFNKIATEQAATALEKEADERTAAQAAAEQVPQQDETATAENTAEESATEEAVGAVEAGNKGAEVAESVDKPAAEVEDDVDVEAGEESSFVA